MLAIPGPSIIPERVLLAMHRASPNIYEGALIDTVDTLYPDLKAVARTDGHVAIYIANGHGAWEAALRNTVNPGETVLVLSTGRFGAGWGDIATAMGVETQVLDFGMQAAADARQVEDILRADTAGDIRAVLTVLTDTASGVRNDIAALRAAIDAAKHDALLMVDCVASLGCDRYEMDALGADVTVAACQKGLMTPPGLGFVYFNERASSFRARTTPGYYWDWVPRTTADYFYQRFGGTAPTHHIFGLREALDMLVHEEGVEAVWARHEKLASAVWAALDVWGSHSSQHRRTGQAQPCRHHHRDRAARCRPHPRMVRAGSGGDAGDRARASARRAARPSKAISASATWATSTFPCSPARSPASIAR